MYKSRMKYIWIYAFHLLLSLNVLAADYISVELEDSTSFSGELIEVYEDRWFYETRSEDTKKYILVFELKENLPVFHFEDLGKVKNISNLYKSSSNYKRYLENHSLVLQNELVPGASVLTGHEGHHKHEAMFGNFAWDIGILDLKGNQYSGKGRELEDYYIFNKTVFSPIAGVVVGKVNDNIDNKPDLSFRSDLSNKTNNYLTVQINENFYFSIVHFKEDSINVNIGDYILPGKELGRVGNSGVSYLPHLHYTMYLYIPKFKRFISVPTFFAN